MEGKYYLVTLQGQGDIYVKVVNQEVFNWIHSEKPKELQNKISVKDPSVPKSVREDTWDEMSKLDQEDYGSKEDLTFEISGSSYKNDRAIYATATKFKGKELFFFSVKKAYDFLNKQNIKIEKEYEGQTY